MNPPEQAEWRTVIRFAEEQVVRPLLKGLGIDAFIEIRHREEGTILSLEHAAESGRLIGRDGHTLEAIQYLVNLLVNKRFATTRTVLIDCAGYRDRSRTHIEKLARDAAGKVKQTGEPVTLDPMVAADRRLVHTLLRDWAGLQTISIDEDPESGMKRVQISRVGYVPGSKQQGRAPGEPDTPDAEPFPPETDDDEAPPEPFPPVEE